MNFEPESPGDRLTERESASREPVPTEGIEPTRPCGHWILSPARLPIPPRRLFYEEATTNPFATKRKRQRRQPAILKQKHKSRGQESGVAGVQEDNRGQMLWLQFLTPVF